MKATSFRAFHAVNGHTVSAGTSFVKGYSLPEAAANLAAQHGVCFLDSGRLTFTDKKGRPVSLYLYIDPEQTAKGQLAIAQHRARSILDAQDRAEILELVEKIGIAVALQRLKCDTIAPSPHKD